MRPHQAIVPASPGFTVRLVAGILAIVGVSLGVPFLVIGLVGTAEDADAFMVMGAAVLAVGLVLAVLWVIGARRARRRLAAEHAARTQRAQATVLEATLRTHSRIGGRHPLQLRVQLAGAERTRRFWALPVLLPAPGEVVDVAFDPADPGNFAVVG